MAGTKYGSFAVGDANIDNVMLQLAGVETGYCALTLTEMTTTNVPQIAAGSKIEVGGSLFKFDANETITGSATTGTNYIQLVPSGSSITAAWTTTAPTWSDSKQGWYDGTGAYRYVGTSVYSSGAYTEKGILINFGGLPLTVSSNGLVLTTFNSFTASQLTIRKLNMYAYGDITIYDMPNSGTTNYLAFTVLRPCSIFNSNGFANSYVYANGTYNTWETGIQGKHKFDLTPGTYRFSSLNGAGVQPVRLIYAEGITTLTLSNCITNIVYS